MDDMTVDSTAGVPVAFLPQEAHGLRGRLGFCPAPGRWRFDASVEPDRMLDGDLASLCTCGATVLVVLLEEEEMARIGLSRLRDSAASAGLEVLWLPIPDGTAPSDIEATARLVTVIL